MTVKKIVNSNNINSVNPLYLMINEIIGHFEEKNENKYLVLEDVDENNEVSKKIDVNKTSVSKECELCHHWVFKDIGFKFEEHVCSRCHDLLTMAYSLKNIAILSAKGATSRCLLMGTSKNEVLKK